MRDARKRAALRDGREPVILVTSRELFNPECANKAVTRRICILFPSWSLLILKGFSTIMSYIFIVARILIQLDDSEKSFYILLR